MYLLNYAGCHECQKKSFVDESEKSSEEEDDGNEENVTFKRTNATNCKQCFIDCMARMNLYTYVNIGLIFQTSAGSVVM